MEPVEVTRADVDVLAECWVTLASGMERYTELNELAVEEPKRPGQGSTDNSTASIRPSTPFSPGTSGGYLTLRAGTPPSRDHSTSATIVDLFVGRAQGEGPRQRRQ